MLVREQAGDRGRAEPVTGVQLEHAADDWRLALVRDEVLVVVAAVAEGESAVCPAPLLGAPFDAGGDAVDDRGVLELGEHGEHLQHHPARGRAGVERLGRRAQRHPDPIQLLGELRELAHLPRQPVDAVDEQQIDRAGARELERGLQAGPLELGAGRAVLLVGDDPPALLRGTERLQPLPLRVQRGRLVLLVGRDPGVDADANRKTPFL